ncbi:hypothetical protein SBI67_18570 [Mycolicibacterium sp. 120266]|nr:hypothetical protein [Mycolicibacterium sp. 120266]MDX1874127.1 hypothetical protein [Mycolicibacterium sp. 120266]
MTLRLPVRRRGFTGRQDCRTPAFGAGQCDDVPAPKQGEATRGLSRRHLA